MNESSTYHSSITGEEVVSHRSLLVGKYRIYRATVPLADSCATVALSRDEAVLARLLDHQGGLRADTEAAELLAHIEQATSAEQRALLLVVLHRTLHASVIAAVVTGGLARLKVWLAAAADGGDAELLQLILRVLPELPADQSSIDGKEVVSRCRRQIGSLWARSVAFARQRMTTSQNSVPRCSHSI